MRQFVRRLLVAAPLAALLFAPGCGSSSSSSPTAALSVALADKPSDDVTSFSLTFSAISLTSSTGAVKQLLPAPIVVDLATLSTFSQLVNLDLVDPGKYTSASVTVNFTGATCFLNGKTTPAALVDDLGVPLTGSMTLPLDFTASPFTAVAGQHHVMELDFNFNQMLSVDLTNNQVEVVPTVEVRFDRTDQNALAAYGQGLSLNISSSSGVLQLESLAGVQLRQIALSFDANTVFQVDGVPFVGTAGMSALGPKNKGTWFSAYGVAQPGSQSIAVTYIEAGKGSWNGVLNAVDSQDLVDGYILDRAGAAGADPSFTVFGMSSNAAHTALQFNKTFTVDATFLSTHIVSRGSSSVFTANAVNVGQHIQAYGTLSLTTLDATASTGVIRAVATTLSGAATGAPVGTDLTINLARVGPLDQTLFIWGDSGTTTPDPANFLIDVGTLTNGLTIGAATPLVVSANLRGVDNAGPEVATATLVQDVTSGPVLLSLRDRANGFDVVTVASGSQVTFTITGVQGADETASLDSGFQGVVPLPTAPDPTVGVGTTPSIFTIYHPSTNTTDSFAVYSDFVAALGTALAGTETLRQFTATGSYLGAISNAFAADSATAVLQ